MLDNLCLCNWTTELDMQIPNILTKTYFITIILQQLSMHILYKLYKNGGSTSQAPIG